MPKGHSIQKIAQIAMKSNGKCFYCGNEPTGIDHLIPLNKGGTEDISNKVLCCRKCNSKKHTRTLENFLLLLSLQEIDKSVNARLSEDGKTITLIIPTGYILEDHKLLLQFINKPFLTEKYKKLLEKTRISLTEGRKNETRI
uniref:HNH endonuclease n=1 Tax=Caldisericum exile TaxID=693075 RepID=A0A7C4TW92_9BACT